MFKKSLLKKVTIEKGSSAKRRQQNIMQIKKQIQAYLQTKYELFGFFLLLLSLFGGIFFLWTSALELLCFRGGTKQFFALSLSDPGLLFFCPEGKPGKSLGTAGKGEKGRRTQEDRGKEGAFRVFSSLGASD